MTVIIDNNGLHFKDLFIKYSNWITQCELFYILALHEENILNMKVSRVILEFVNDEKFI